MLTALLIGMLIVYPCVNYLLQNKLAWRGRIALLQIHDEASLILARLRYDIKRAGYVGCPLLTAQFEVYPKGQLLFNFRNRITGSRNAITCRYASTQFSVLKNAPDAHHLITEGESIFHIDDWLVSSACTGAEVFKVEKIDKSQNEQILTIKKPLYYKFKPGAEISKLVVNTISYNDVTKSIYIQPLRGNKSALSNTGLSLHFHYYYLDQGQFRYHHHTIAQDYQNLRGVAVRLTFTQVNMHWYTYVPT
jgi:hypothetical protein